MKKWTEIISLVLSVKIAIFLLIACAYFLLPFGSNYYLYNFVYPPHQSISLLSAFKTWDAQHYIYLSEQGYHTKDPSSAFAPLFPFFMYFANFITKNSFVSGILLSNIFSTIGMYYFYLLVGKLYNEKIAYRSLIFLLAFPTAFYFSLIYTESLFFLLVILFFLFLQKKKLFLASFMAFLLPLARTIGVAIFLPFLTSYILEIKKHSLYDEFTAVLSTFLQKSTWFLFSPFLGIGVLLVFLYVTTGNPLTQFIMQGDFLAKHSFLSVFNLSVFFKQFFTFPLVLHGFTNSLLDRLFFIGFLFVLPFLFKRVSKTFSVYAVLFGLLPVLSGSFMSYMRYLLIVFPLFILFAKLSLEKRYQRYTFPLLFASLLLQSLFIIMQSLNYWVS